jgi:hypothetical protein
MQAKKLTTQKLHKVIQAAIGVKSSLHSPSQRISRSTYDLCSMFKGFYTVISANYMSEIKEALTAAEIAFQYDDRKQVLIIRKFQ